MNVIKQWFSWVDFDIELFMWSPEFYLVCIFVCLLALVFSGTYLISDAEDDA